MLSQLLLSAAYCDQISVYLLHTTYKKSIFCYHLVNEVRYGPAQSDHIKQCLPTVNGKDHIRGKNMFSVQNYFPENNLIWLFLTEAVN
jgi:hypothetical protein